MYKSQYNNKSLSSYWMDDWKVDDSFVVIDEAAKRSLNLYKLASGRRAISNFVNIVTNKNIPVIFKTSGTSCTDGHRVVISSKIESPKDFDRAVGLALHEGSHVAESDFSVLTNLSSDIPQQFIKKSEELGITNYYSVIKSILNYVEDRRIDMYVYTQSPGYRGYYQAMYDYYWYSQIIDKGLKSSEHRTESPESYSFRLINIHNENTDLNALKGLREIYRILDLQNIGRLKNSTDSRDVAFDIYEVMLKYLVDQTPQPEEPEQPEQPQNSSDEDGDGSETENRDDNGSDGDGSDESGDDSDSSGDSDGEAGDGEDDENQTDGAGGSMSGTPDDSDVNAGDDSDSNESDAPDLTEKQKRQLENQLKKQKEFINGDTKKKQITKKIDKEIQQIEESGTELSHCGNDVEGHWSGTTQGGVDVIVVKKMTKALMESDSFPLTSSWSPMDGRFQDEVNRGIQIGKVLGKKLQTRGESRTTIFNRQKIGKLDKRLISSLGYGNESVFQFTDVDTYKKANLHVSIDASGSMGGNKWRKTITNVVALCKAVDMIPTLQIQVSIRTTANESPHLPYVVMAYDSRVDKFTKVKQLFPSLYTSGTTPEGLCFEAIMNQFIPDEVDVDSYFLNISDGMPYYGTKGFQYSGFPAQNHTRKMVKMIESRGIQVLSYYISDYEQPVSEGFNRMYGSSNTSGIDVTNISQIVKTMNQLFMKKK